MKRMLLFFLLGIPFAAVAQNEFAATAFYTEFKKILADAQNGFLAIKGTKRPGEYPELNTEYRSKILLPLADSGKIVIPQTGVPYALFYFEPDKVRLKVDQRGMNLRDAIAVACNCTLFTRSETSIINNYPFTQMLYFSKEGETRFSEALFRQLVYFNEGKYYLSLEIRGKATN